MFISLASTRNWCYLFLHQPNNMAYHGRVSDCLWWTRVNIYHWCIYLSNLDSTGTFKIKPKIALQRRISPGNQARESGYIIWMRIWIYRQFALFIPCDIAKKVNSVLMKYTTIQHYFKWTVYIHSNIRALLIFIRLKGYKAKTMRQTLPSCVEVVVFLLVVQQKYLFSY